MTELITQSLVNVFPWIVPEAVLVLASCVLFLGGTFRASKNLWAGVALVSLILAALAWWLVPFHEPKGDEEIKVAMFSAPFFADYLAKFIRAFALVGGIVLVLFSWDEIPDGQAADFHGCLLLIIAGLSLTGSANELVTLFLALELISIPTYILLYLPRFDNAAQEAAMKYFLLSIFSSAMLLFGFSYLYGLAGTTNLPGIIDALNRDEPGRLPAVVLVALVMIVAGLGFRITAVPFHYYAPDVYQGAPTIGAALLAFVPKVAGFTALLRLLGLVWAGKGVTGLTMGEQAPILFWILAVVTMSLGNVLALLQNNLKRLFAYSSVAHAGYMLIGIAVAYPFSEGEEASSGPGGVSALLFYLVGYAAMTVGVFAVLSYLSTPFRPVENEDDIAGLSRDHPGIALLMAIFLFSLIGIPLTAGFAGKFLLFWGAMAEKGDHVVLFRWLALIGVFNAAIGAYYYLRILSKMYLYPPFKPMEKSGAWPGLAAIWICASVTITLGIYPNLLLPETNRAAVQNPESSVLTSKP